MKNLLNRQVVRYAIVIGQSKPVKADCPRQDEIMIKDMVNT